MIVDVVFVFLVCGDDMCGYCVFVVEYVIDVGVNVCVEVLCEIECEVGFVFENWGFGDWVYYVIRIVVWDEDGVRIFDYFDVFDVKRSE